MTLMKFRRLFVSIVLAGYVALPAPAILPMDGAADSQGTVQEFSASVSNPNAAHSSPKEERDAAEPAEDADSSCTDNDELTSAIHWNASFFIGALSFPQQFITLIDPSFPINKPPQN